MDGRRPGLQIRTKKKLRVVIDIFYGIIRDGIMYSLGLYCEIPRTRQAGVDKLEVSGGSKWERFGSSSSAYLQSLHATIIVWNKLNGMNMVLARIMLQIPTSD